MTKEQVSKPFYSNCFIQALWHKMLHPFKTKIVFISARINESHCPHFFWCDETGDYDFTIMTPTDKTNIFNLLLFRGYIQKRNCGFAKRYQMQRKEKVGRR
jgi:hypothetical protein